MAGLLQRTGDALKAFQMVFARGGTGGGWGRFNKLSDPWWERAGGYAPSAGESYDPAKAAGDVSVNGAVAICIGFVARNLMQARLQVLDRAADGTEEEALAHPLTELVHRPNPHYGRKELLGSVAADYLMDGNGFWLKVRDRGGRVSELWWAPRSMIRPDSPQDGSSFLSGYIYRVEGKDYRLPREDVVHFRFPKLDPQDQRLGIAPLKALLREIGTDNEITTFTGAILQNMGIPGAVLVPTATDPNLWPEITPETGDRLRAMWKQLTTGGNRGNLIVPTFPSKLEKAGFTPQELAVDKLGERPEARICAAIGVPPMAVNLSVGATQRTYANYAEAREAAWEECILPMNGSMAEDIDWQLLPDLEKKTSRRVDWDYSKVRALREDEDAKSTRYTGEWLADGITLNEYRAALGKPALPPEAGDKRKSELGAPVAGVEDGQDLAKLTNAAAQLIRSGFEPGAALAAVGLNPITHLGLLPVTLQREEEESAGDRAAREGREAREARPNPNGKG